MLGRADTGSAASIRETIVQAANAMMMRLFMGSCS
jgi:hypothetical protein